MMRKLYYAATGAFWFAFAGFWIGALTQPEVAAAPAERSIALTEIARHATVTDCWMAINGQVYDLTAYAHQHPAEPALLAAWCGKEASEAYRTKTKGRPHSPYADQLLPKYRIGTLAPAR